MLGEVISAADLDIAAGIEVVACSPGQRGHATSDVEIPSRFISLREGRACKKHRRGAARKNGNCTFHCVCLLGVAQKRQRWWNIMAPDLGAPVNEWTPPGTRVNEWTGPGRNS